LFLFNEEAGVFNQSVKKLIQKKQQNCIYHVTPQSDCAP